MNSLILISPSKGFGFQPILSGKVHRYETVAAMEDCFGRRTLPANNYNNSSIRYPGRQSTSSTAAIYFVDEFGKSLETLLIVLGAVKIAIGDRPVIKIILVFRCMAFKFGILSKRHLLKRF